MWYQFIGSKHFPISWQLLGQWLATASHSLCPFSVFPDKTPIVLLFIKTPPASNTNKSMPQFAICGETPDTIQIPTTLSLYNESMRNNRPDHRLPDSSICKMRHVNRTCKSGSSSGLTANIQEHLGYWEVSKKGAAVILLSKLHPEGLCYCLSTTVTVLGRVHKQLL